MTVNLPTTVYQPGRFQGEMSRPASKNLVTKSGLNLVTKSGLNLVTKESAFTPLPPTVYSTNDQR